MSLLEKIGYGQVEFNKVNSQVTKEIIATMPANSSIAKVEMGMFLVPDYAKGELKLPTKGAAAYIVNNEMKLYDDRETRKDFVLEKMPANGHYVVQDIYPRGYKMTVGDVLHTNLIDGFTSNSEAGTLFSVGTNGILAVESNAANAAMVFTLEEVSTMPDGQVAAKLVCTKANY